MADPKADKPSFLSRLFGRRDAAEPTERVPDAPPTPSPPANAAGDLPAAPPSVTTASPDTPDSEKVPAELAGADLQPVAGIEPEGGGPREPIPRAEPEPEAKRREEPEIRSEPKAEAGKEGWWQRLRQGMRRTSTSLSDSVTGVFTKRKLDATTLEDLEDTLVQADLGIDIALKIAQAVGEGRYNREISPDEVKGINELGYLASRYDIYQDVMPIKDESEIDMRAEWVPDNVVLRADGTRMTAWLTSDKKQFMKRCPNFWLRTARKTIPKDLATRPYLGRFIDVTTAESLYECYDPKHPLTATEKRQRGVELLLENTPNGLSSAERLLTFFEMTHMDLNVCLDVGHANMNEGVETAYRMLKPRIRSTHIHDNNGEHDAHLFPLMNTGGTIDWRRTMELLQSAPDQYPLLLELREVEGMQHPIQVAQSLFDRLEGLTDAARN